MWNKKSKILYLFIVVLVILWGVYQYNDGKNESLKYTGRYTNLYYGVSYKGNGNFVDKLSLLKLSVYDEDTKKKTKYDLENVDAKGSFDLGSINSFDEWILIQTINKDRIYGINVTSGEVTTLVNTDSTYMIKSFALSGGKIIYSTSNGSITKVHVKDLNNNNVITLGEYNTNLYIPVSIHDNKASILVDNKITVIDLIYNKALLTTEAIYTENAFLFKDKIYTFNSTNASFVQLDLNLNEKVLLANPSISSYLYSEGDKIVLTDYFYDTNTEKMYLRKMYNTLIGNRIILGDYILNSDLKYEKLKEGENYIEYPLRGDMFVGISQNIDSKTVLKVLNSGEVITTKVNSNELIKHFDGLEISDYGLLWDVAYSNNKVYIIKGISESSSALLSLDLETGDVTIVKELNYPISNLKQIATNGSDVGYLLRNDDETKFGMINLESKEETSYNFDISFDVKELFLNDKYIAILTWEENVLRLYGKYTGNILALSKEEFTNLYGITKEGLILDNIDGKLGLYDFKLKKSKSFSSYDKAIKYLYK